MAVSRAGGVVTETTGLQLGLGFTRMRVESFGLNVVGGEYVEGSKRICVEAPQR